MIICWTGLRVTGLFDLDIRVKGDVEVDSHHTIEDAGIVLGQAIANALGDKAGIKRYGYFILPMDETLALCAVDLSGRPYLNMMQILPCPGWGHGYGNGAGIFLCCLI